MSIITLPTPSSVQALLAAVTLLATIQICVVNVRPVRTAQDVTFRRCATICLAVGWGILALVVLRHLGLRGHGVFFFPLFLLGRSLNKKMGTQA